MTRLLVIGIDGGTPEVVERLVRAGRMPHLARLSREGAARETRCTWPPHTAPGWATLFAGALPGQHGVHQFWDCQEPEGELVPTPSTALETSCLFDDVTAAGGTVGLLNLPMSHPPRPWPGYQFTWPLAPTLHYAQPREILRELEAAGGLVASDLACLYDGRPGYLARALSYIERRTRGVIGLLRTRPTDAVIVVYPEVDRVQHHYWHTLDRAREGDGPDAGTVEAVYEAIDASIGHLVDAVSDECLVVVASDHGFGPARAGFRVNASLAEAGFCQWVPRERGPSQPGDHALDAARPDMAQTVAYSPVPGCFGVNLALRGRQKGGRVSNEDAESALGDVESFLQALRDPTGATVFSAVLRREQAWSGRCLASAPDLLLVPRDPGLLVLHEPDGPVWGDPGQTGIHRINGILIARGPRVAESALPDEVPLESVRSLIGGWMGLGPALAVEEGPLEPLRRGLPTDAFRERPAVRLVGAAAPPDARPGDLPLPRDSAEVARRLRETGYR